MNNISYFYMKLLYFFFKYIYLLVNKFNMLLFIYFYLLKMFNYLVFMSDEIYYDYYHFSSILSKSFKLYKKLGILKHIFMMFFFFAGFIPLFLIISFCFFFIKYMFKYIFLTLDFFLKIDDDDEESYYYYMKYYIMYFFGYMPYLIIKLYKFLFKSSWTSYFINKFMNYLKNKKDKLISYFINKMDYFFLVYMPSKYENLKPMNFHDMYMDFMVMFFKVSKKMFVTVPWFISSFIISIYKSIYMKMYKNIILSFYSIHFLSKYLAVKFFYLKCESIYSDIYHYILYKYKHMKYYLIWLFKVYMWSEACYMTMEAFFDLNYLNGKAYLKYMFMHLYYSFCYGMIYKWCEFLKLMFKSSYFFNCLHYYIKKLMNKKVNYYYFYSWHYYYCVIFHFFMWWTSMFLKTHFFMDFNFECYQVDFGDKSQTWWNMKMYDVVALFFVSAYASAPISYKLSFFKMVYHMRFNWFYGNMYDSVTNWFYFYFWVKGWSLWVWFYNTFLD